MKCCSCRPQVPNNTTHRPATIQRVRIGAGRDGKITAIAHESLSGNLPDGKPETATDQTKLLYAGPNRTVIADVIVRYSKIGDFDLTLSKGPGVTLLSLRQDASFAEVRGPMARGGWSGRVDRAPKQLRGWLELRDKIIESQDRHVIRHVAGREAFVFRF